MVAATTTGARAHHTSAVAVAAIVAAIAAGHSKTRRAQYARDAPTLAHFDAARRSSRLLNAIGLEHILNRPRPRPLLYALARPLYARRRHSLRYYLPPAHKTPPSPSPSPPPPSPPPPPLLLLRISQSSPPPIIERLRARARARATRAVASERASERTHTFDEEATMAAQRMREQGGERRARPSCARAPYKRCRKARASLLHSTAADLEEC